LARLELEYHGAADAPGPATRGPDLRREFAHGRFDVAEQAILGERVLGRYRTGRPVRRHALGVAAARELRQALPVATELAFEIRIRPRAQVRAGADAERREAPVGDLADARDARDRQRREEGVDLVRPDHEQAVRLAPVRRDLGE